VQYASLPRYIEGERVLLLGKRLVSLSAARSPIGSFAKRGTGRRLSLTEYLSGERSGMFRNPDTPKCNECACLQVTFPNHLRSAYRAMDNAAAKTLSGEKQQSAPDTPAIIPDEGPTESQASDVVPTTKLQFFPILVALVFSIFTVALDGTIIVTAIPCITDDY
jgi:hypothetical protein